MFLRRGDIVLVPFPFTDLSDDKVRPAVIISSDPQADDLVLAFISSMLPARPATFEYILKSSDTDFRLTGLKVSSAFKLRKLITLERSQILRHLGQTSPALQSKLNNRLARAVGLKL